MKLRNNKRNEKEFLEIIKHESTKITGLTNNCKAMTEEQQQKAAKIVFKDYLLKVAFEIKKIKNGIELKEHDETIQIITDLPIEII